MRVLTGRFLCRAMSQLLVRNTWDQLWLRAFDDIAQQAIVRGQITSATELLNFLLTPILTGLSDTVGRRPVQVFCAAMNLGYHICGLTLAVEGSVVGLILGQLVFALSEQAQTLQRASMGDLWMAKGASAYSSALSTMELCYPCSKMTMPLLAALIIRGGRLRRVYFLSTFLALSDTLVALLGPESLPEAERKPFRMRSVHPLSFLRIFTAGRKLRRLAIVQFLGNGSDSGYGTDPPEQIANLHRSTTLGWSVAQRAQWDSLTALTRLLFVPTVSMAVRRLGQLNTWTIGSVVYLTHTIPLALTNNFCAIYATLPSHAFIMHRVSVERVMVAGAGRDAGFAQGALLGMSANLRWRASCLRCCGRASTPRA